MITWSGASSHRGDQLVLKFSVVNEKIFVRVVFACPGSLMGEISESEDVCAKILERLRGN